ncbi:MAG: CopG family transcriptional regulator [Thermoplasmata archaeon]
MVSDPSKEVATRTVALPEELVRAVETRIQGSAFDSAGAFVAFVLARLLEEPSATVFSEEDERQLRERLRSLGYID